LPGKIVVRFRGIEPLNSRDFHPCPLNGAGIPVATLIGHTTFNWALRWISPTFVTLSILFEPVGASFLGWLILQEIPSSSVLGAGIIVLIGVAIAITGDQSKAAKIDNQ
jgi:drug/metabolite transporter (DMT)-like permease